MFKLFLSCLVFASILLERSRSSPMEDLMETEIDVREPISFGVKKMHSVRNRGFSHLKHKGQHSDAIFIPNWEIFATKYVVNIT